MAIDYIHMQSGVEHPIGSIQSSGFRQPSGPTSSALIGLQIATKATATKSATQNFFNLILLSTLLIILENSYSLII